MTMLWFGRDQRGFPGNVASLNVDIFRSFLAQWVIVAHLASELLPIPLVPGRLAVWGFFVVSGYLNAISFSRCLEHGAWGAATRAYYWKRIKRIYPVLVASYLIVSAFLGTMINRDIGILIPLEYVNHVEYSNSVLWTLVIEIQLYIVTPVVFLLARKVSHRAPLLILLLISAGLIYLVTISHVVIFQDRSMLDDRSMPGNLGFYLFGMFVALKPHTARGFKESTFKIVIGVTAIATLIFLALYNFKSPAVTFFFGQIIALAFSFYFLTLQRPVFQTGQSVYRFLGYFTYEIYALHGLFIFISHRLQVPDTAFWTVAFAWVLPMLTVLSLSATIAFVRSRVFR